VPNFQIHVPKLLDRYGVHHTKMVLLEYTKGLRVAVFTNNFIKEDWTWKVQGIFVQDFPFFDTVEHAAAVAAKKRNKDHLGPYSQTMFGPVLSNYLQIVGVCGWGDLIPKYDFRAARGALIPSVPGSFSNSSLNLFGHMRLRFLQSKSANETTESATLCAQVSSFGSIDETFLNDLKDSMLGKQLSKNSSQAPTNVRLTIAWPSQETVRTSNQGWGAGNSLCMSLKNQKGFLFGQVGGATKQVHSYLVKWKPVNDVENRNATPHIKTYCGGPTLRRRSPREEEEDEKEDTHDSIECWQVPWVLLTSANMSKSAWGTLQNKQTVLKISHYEMGVLIRPEYVENKTLFTLTPEHPILGHFALSTQTPANCFLQLKLERKYEMEDDSSSLPVSICTPIPHIITEHEPFIQGDSVQPWCWKKPFPGRDMFDKICDGSFEK